MGRLLSEKERKLQRKLIPLNIVVCVLCLVAAITLFFAPLFNVNVGKILKTDAALELTDKAIDEAIGEVDNGGEGINVDYKPVVQKIVKNVFGKAEGSISVSGISAMKVLTGSEENKAEILLDDLLFGDNALATRLINSVVDSVGDMFETEEGKAAIEQTLITTLSKAFVDEAKDGVADEEFDKEFNEKFTDENAEKLVEILSELGDTSKVPNGKVDSVTNKFIDEVEVIMGDDFKVDSESRESIIETVQQFYDETKAELKPGESVSVEAILCVTLSKNVDLNQINIRDLIDSFGSENGEKTNDVHREAVEATTDDPPADGKIVTNYKDLLGEIGFGEDDKEELKTELRAKLETVLKDTIEKENIDDSLQYYGYLTFACLAFMLPWVILFLFSFFHIFAKNKRFTMWYVKIFGWIPAIFWLALKLTPVAIDKVLPSFMDAESMKSITENRSLIDGVLSGVSSLTWITGLCYVLLWGVSLFWAFPIKHKIRKERKAVKRGEAEGYGE